MRTMQAIALTPRDRQAVQAAAAMLRQSFPVDRIVLYGSKVRGDDDRESDIDLLVITAHRLDGASQRDLFRRLLTVQMTFDVVINPLLVDRRQWEEGEYQVLPIRAEIDREGVEV